MKFVIFRGKRKGVYISNKLGKQNIWEQCLGI